MATKTKPKPKTKPVSKPIKKKKKVVKKSKPLNVVVILDKSGSMMPHAADTVCGFNNFIEEQKKLKSNIKVSLYQFDDRYYETFSDLPLDKVKPLALRDTYCPSGNTALYDAIGKTLTNAESTGDNYMFVIQTDGQENSSREFCETQIKTLITRMEKAGHKFLYLAANLDSYVQFQVIGAKPQHTLTYGNDMNYALTTASLAVTKAASGKAYSVDTLKK